jgi:hypothetical protein
MLVVLVVGNISNECAANSHAMMMLIPFGRKMSHWLAFLLEIRNFITILAKLTHSW